MNKQIPHPMTSESTRQDWVEYLHTSGRDQYDTPGSVKYCACADCNRARRVHDRPQWRWTGKFRAVRVAQ